MLFSRRGELFRMPESRAAAAEKKDELMSNTMTSLKLGVERLFARLGLGMRAKLITLFVFIKVVPLVLLALLAWNQAWELGEELKRRTA